MILMNAEVFYVVVPCRLVRVFIFTDASEVRIDPKFEVKSLYSLAATLSIFHSPARTLPPPPSLHQPDSSTANTDG